MSNPPDRAPPLRRSKSSVVWGADDVRTFHRDALADGRDAMTPATERTENDGDDHTDRSAYPTPAFMPRSDARDASSADASPIDEKASGRDGFPFPGSQGSRAKGPRVSQMPAFPPPPVNSPPQTHSSRPVNSSRPPQPPPYASPQRNKAVPIARSFSAAEEGGRESSMSSINGGILYSMMQLSALRRRGSNAPSIASTAAPSRCGSTAGDDLPTFSSLGLQRSFSTRSTGTVVDREGLDEDHPAITGVKRGRDRAGQQEIEIKQELKGGEEDMSEAVQRKLERKMIQYHMSSVKARQAFMQKLAKALISFGFPPHRLEPTLDSLATFLHLDATTSLIAKRLQIVYEDKRTGTSLTKIIRAAPALALGKLHDTHMIYRAVMHDEISIDDGSRKLDEIFKAPEPYPLWGKVLIVWGCGLFICPAFGGSILDSLIVSVPGAIIFLGQQYIASKSNNLKSISNLLAAIIGAFYARGLASTGYFCFEAIASASIVFILPAFPALCGALELLNENWDRAVASIGYSVLYVVVLGMGLSIGSQIFCDIANYSATSASTENIEGIFVAENGTLPLFEGSFTFTNDTSSASSLAQGNVNCFRDPSWPWWRQSISQYGWTWIIYIPAFALLLSMLNGQPFRKKQTLLMVIIAVLGQAANTAASRWLLGQTYVVNVVGPFVLGISAIVASRISHGKQTALTLMLPGVLVSVPGGIAAAGGLAMTQGGATDVATSALSIGGRMISVATGISVGLIMAAAVGYVAQLHKKRTAIFSF
ncbi:DUF1212-domain-containing protein [Calocera cornea HHB12733]|uniref:DUF1212-domain-containing protein n=1 Tax=Calocera cornea HHB12733 TaxID=1353952 RepID=A0A165FIS2_9BASI|nr:DUF1212-domain-containing protein [Calocera cornea HHB12733]